MDREGLITLFLVGFLVSVTHNPMNSLAVHHGYLFMYLLPSIHPSILPSTSTYDHGVLLCSGVKSVSPFMISNDFFCIVCHT